MLHALYLGPHSVITVEEILTLSVIAYNQFLLVDVTLQGGLLPNCGVHHDQQAGPGSYGQLPARDSGGLRQDDPGGFPWSLEGHRGRGATMLARYRES